MYCPKCGKEISDDSKFCYNCGLKIDFVKSSENLDKDSISPINKETDIKNQDIKEKIPITNNDQTDLNPPLKTKCLGYGWFGLYFHIKDMISKFIQRQIHLKNEYPGYGWVVLLLFYLYGGSKMDQLYEDYSLIIFFLGFIGILPIYFWFRKFLIKNNFWKGHIGSSSLLSGIVTYILVFILVGGSISLISNYEKRKEINQFTKDYIKQTETIKNKELDFRNYLMVSPISNKDFDDHIKTCDKYILFFKDKKTYFNNLINFFNRMKSKSKNEKILTVKINELEKLFNHMNTSSEVGIGLLKSYYITGKETYYDQHYQIYLEQQKLKNDISKQMTDIYNLL